MLHVASYLQMSPETLSRVRAAHLEEAKKEKDEASAKPDPSSLPRP